MPLEGISGNSARRPILHKEDKDPRPGQARMLDFGQFDFQLAEIELAEVEIGGNFEQVRFYPL